MKLKEMVASRVETCTYIPVSEFAGLMVKALDAAREKPTGVRSTDITLRISEYVRASFGDNNRSLVTPDVVMDTFQDDDGELAELLYRDDDDVEEDPEEVLIRAANEVIKAAKFDYIDLEN